MKPDQKELKVELLCKGIVLDDTAQGFFKRSMGFPIVYRGSVINAPFFYRGFKRNRHPYVKNSPFSLTREDGHWNLYRDGEHYANVEVSPTPHFYGKLTSDGIEMRRIAPLCGEDCLLTGVEQRCDYWKRGMECKFCGIPLNTFYENRLQRKTPQQLFEVVEAGVEEGRVKRVLLSIGGRQVADKGANNILECAKAIKECFDIPLQVELLPPRVEDLEKLSQYADCFNTNIEIFDPELRTKLMPGKGKILLEEYYKTLAAAVEFFGEGQVQSVIILGLEKEDTLIEGCEKLVSLGVFPSLSPFRPTKATDMEDCKPVDTSWAKKMYELVGEMVKDYGLRPEKNRGCERCGGCGALREYAA